MSSKRNSKAHYHVIPVSGGWNVRLSGAQRAARHFEKKAEAINYARELVRGHEDGEIVVHRPDGRVQSRDVASDSLPRRLVRVYSHG